VLLLRRFLRAQREREQFRQEIEQARQLQQMLIPEALPHIAGLTIESEYRPALQVGGDFFQIIPESANGGVLIVVGDVTGHGLKAGMLVALIVGVIRNETTHTQDPLLVLQALNRTLCERRHAHATCLALRIASGGQATLANAGHLPPYLNGKELPMEGAMLLGMIEGVEFSVMHFQLQPGDVLMMMSDGIAEAQNEQGQLFGFERIGEMLRAATPQEPVSAAAMATAAQNFGQEDDISVLAITRSVNRASAIA
jgi:serine phosphatase RsbU (regulator of sigma subunit)